MTITPTDFRKDLFNILDGILNSGKTLELNRNGHIFKIIPPKQSKKLDRLVVHNDAIIGNSDEFISMDWSSEWKPSI
ncbi:MAG TPA: type II toxin-antitoxin system Phd/YefM family antitoxin [Flavobacteriaceae bacterium]|nr:type II toxin-antitoxin system Phd/YefM family antitoxin [Flavobacteriaceae bacterium]